MTTIALIDHVTGQGDTGYELRCPEVYTALRGGVELHYRFPEVIPYYYVKLQLVFLKNEKFARKEVNGGHTEVTEVIYDLYRGERRSLNVLHYNTPNHDIYVQYNHR